MTTYLYSITPFSNKDNFVLLDDSGIHVDTCDLSTMGSLKKRLENRDPAEAILSPQSWTIPFQSIRRAEFSPSGHFDVWTEKQGKETRNKLSLASRHEIENFAKTLRDILGPSWVAAW